MKTDLVALYNIEPDSDLAKTIAELQEENERLKGDNEKLREEIKAWVKGKAISRLTEDEVREMFEEHNKTWAQDEFSHGYIIALQEAFPTLLNPKKDDG